MIGVTVGSSLNPASESPFLRKPVFPRSFSISSGSSSMTSRHASTVAMEDGVGLAEKMKGLDVSLR